MPIRITARFPDPDSADNARARLRESGVDARAMSVDRTNEGMTVGGISTGRQQGTDVVINPYVTGYSGVIDETMTSLAGANMQTYGGFLWSFADSPLRTYGAGRPQAPGEVQLCVSAQSAGAAAAAESILISCHGTEITRES